MEKLEYTLIFHPKIPQDIEQFDRSVQKQIQGKLEKIRKNPELWKPLIGELAGCRKMYVADKKIRIVYRIHHDTIIISVIAIGKRDNEEVYREAGKRME